MEKTINFEQARTLGWCWFKDEERTEQLKRYAAAKSEWTALDILRLPSEEVTDEDKLVAVLRMELIDEKVLHTLACDFAERALSKIEKPHPDSVKAIEVKRRWIRGDAMDEELYAARSAAWKAAARDVTECAAWSAERYAARSAAWSAERAAARCAAWYAARCAARAAERSWQVEHTIEVLDGSR